MDFHLLGVRDLRLHLIVAGIQLSGLDEYEAWFGLNGRNRGAISSPIGRIPDLLGREPEREVPA